MKKPETKIEKTQKPAQGGNLNEDHALDVEAEAKAHKDWPNKVGGHGQGGAGH